MAQRDERGRFLPGNSIAVGNKGNTNPKYNNKNAIKHGFFSYNVPGANALMPSYSGDSLILIINGQAVGVLKNQYWEKDNENATVNPEATEMLSVLGVTSINKHLK